MKPQDHITSIFGEYAVSSRVLRSFTNLSNTVIETALSGQSKFVFEILQNADDSFHKDRKTIEVQFTLHDNYLIVQHNGKGFDSNDVDRICDYASQIKEVKATDLSKTGYKGLGFKSLFNISDCIYIHSNGYSFRFDRTYWEDWYDKPWQVIPIWCSYNELPLKEMFSFDQPVNFILKVNSTSLLKYHLQELVDRPELLLYLNHITKMCVTFNGIRHSLEKKEEEFGVFNKVNICNNQVVVSTWLLKTYVQGVPKRVHTAIFRGSRFIYPEKIKTAKQVPFTFALKINETAEEITQIKGLCHSTLPTQLHLTVPYHVNSFFILNLDRTQLHENEWNTFLINQLGYVQFSLLKDLAQVPHLKNCVIELFVREFKHQCDKFNTAFSTGFEEAKREIAWLPSHLGSHLLKLGDAWIDETRFFKQNFRNIRDEKIYPRLIDYNVKRQRFLLNSEAKRFSFFQLFKDFPKKYYPQLTSQSYTDFISYLYESLNDLSPNHNLMGELKQLPFLRCKNRQLVCPRNALLEEWENPIPEFSLLNPVDNEFLPSENTYLIKDWLARLGAKRLKRPIQILRASVLKWLDSEGDDFEFKINKRNHVEVVNYLSENAGELSTKEMKKLSEKFVIMTEKNQFELANLCYFPDAVPIKELANIISNDEKISSCYDIEIVKDFFVRLGVKDVLSPLEVLRKGILKWIQNGDMYQKLTTSNYFPIIEYISLHYPAVEKNLTLKEIEQLKKMRILTCDGKFSKAENCFFESAVPSIRGFDSVIAKNRLVSTQNISDKVYEFLKKIGVLEDMLPVQVLQRSVLKWIYEDQMQSNMNISNHQDILSYIADQWYVLCYSPSSCLSQNEREALKRIHIKTQCNTLRAACKCYWPPDDKYYEEIPGLNSVIPPGEFVSLDYPKNILELFENLGVHNLSFVDIYEKYCDHLHHKKNLEWFFRHLKQYWIKNRTSGDNKLLNFLQKKFTSSRSLLSTNGKMYCSTDLYCSKFYAMHRIDPDCMPFLDYEKEDLPEDLEDWLGFKKQLELSCIVRLLEALRKKPNLGGNTLERFFTTVLEQLKQKAKDEIKSYKLSLFSQDNKIKPAKELYYFYEEEASCHLDSCYLKRIDGMSHQETLELAELCGVNLLKCEFIEVKFGQGQKISDNTLKEFYLERLPFIVLQEAKTLIDSPSNVLNKLYSKVCSIELYKCPEIFIQYPFGDLHRVRNQVMDGLKIYTIKKWNGIHKSDIHDHLKKELGFKSNVRQIIQMELNPEDIEDWLCYKNESAETLYAIQKELHDLRSKKETPVQDEKIAKSLHADEKKDASEEVSEEDKPLSTESSSEENKPLSTELSSDEEEISLPPGYALQDQESKKIGDAFDEWGRVNIPVDVDVTSDDESYIVEADTDSDDDWQNDYILQKEESVPSLESGIKLRAPSTASLNVESPGIHKEGIGEKQLNRLDKTSLFTFLHDHYKSKYPHSKCNLSGGIFTLRWQPSNKKAIVWLNEKGESYREDIDVKSETESEIDCSSVFSAPDSFPPLTESLKIKLTKIEDTKGSVSLKRLGEKYVFTFLQDHYKNKHPVSRCESSGGTFTVRWQLSHKVEIIWLNQGKDKGLPYDLILKKDGLEKQLIEVESTNLASNDLFNVSHREFVKRKNELEPHRKEKYCIYLFFTPENMPNATAVDNMNNQCSLYKIVPLKCS